MRPACIVAKFRDSTVGRGILTRGGSFSSIVVYSSLVIAGRSGRRIYRTVTRRCRPSSSRVVLFVKRKARRITGRLCPRVSRLFGRFNCSGVRVKAIRKSFSVRDFLSGLGGLRPTRIRLTPFVVITNSRTAGSVSKRSSSS